MAGLSMLLLRVSSVIVIVRVRVKMIIRPRWRAVFVLVETVGGSVVVVVVRWSVTWLVISWAGTD